jgi:hypothetical protein
LQPLGAFRRWSLEFITMPPLIGSYYESSFS